MNQGERIAVFLPSLDGGGAQRVMLTLVNGFAEKGISVDLVLVRAEGPFLDKVNPGVRLVDLGVGRVVMSLPRLVGYLRRERPFALLSALEYVNVIALMARWLARVPIRLVVSEHTSHSESRPEQRSWTASSVGRLMRVTYPSADLIVAVSQGVAADIVKTFSLSDEKVRVICNPVVGPDMLRLASAHLSHPWFRLGEPPVILGVGRLTEEKDFGNLIRAFERLRATREARLMILGEGQLRTDLENLVRELGLNGDVALPGFVDNPYSYMRQSAVFVLSSRREGLPTVLIEAMACGTPVVATDCRSGPQEILEGGVWGRLVPVADPIALADAIAATLDDATQPDVTLRAQNYSVERAVGNYLHALQE